MIQLYLELVVNELPSGRIVQVDVIDDRFYMTRDDLLAAGVRLEAGGGASVALDSLELVQNLYEESTQRLKLRIPSEWLPLQRVGSERLSEFLPAESSLGGLFNYDIYYSDTEDRGSYASVFAEQRVFGRFGVLTNTGLHRQAFGVDAKASDGYFRFDTNWRFNDQARLLSLEAGDLISGALTWNSTVRMGGVQIARNFSLRPDLITYPLLNLTGDVAVPSTVDLYIDNTRQSSEALKPGPFTFSSVPAINGAGQAVLVTTDVQGRQVSTTVPFYVTNSLLKQGLYDYSLSLGRLREAYGKENFAYGPMVGSGTLRYGLNDAVTLESHAEAAAGLRLAGLGSTLGIGTWGTLTSSIAYSQFGQSGQQYSLGYSYYSRYFGIAAQHVERSADYADLSAVGVLGNYLPRRSDQLTFSVTPGSFGSVGVGYFAGRDREGENTRLLNLSWSKGIGDNMSLFVSLNKLIGESGYSAQAQMIIPFDLHSTLSTGIERNPNGDYRRRVNYSRNAPSQGGLGWNLGYAQGRGGDYQQADLTWRAPVFQAQAGLYSDAGRATHWGNLSGSLVAMDGSVQAANRIDDAFVLVSTSGYQGVPVRFEHQLLGTTDKHGRLLVPWVPSYYRGQYEIDPLGLPSNITLRDPQRVLTVHERSGALLDFELQLQLTASITLVDEAGAFLPRGTIIQRLESEQLSAVGWDGLVYFAGLAARNRLEATLPDGRRCSVVFELDPTAEEIALVGPLTCRPDLTDS